MLTGNKLIPIVKCPDVKIFFFIMMLPYCCFAQTEPIILECERIGEYKTTASLEIDLKEGAILFDAHDARENLERLNQAKLKKFHEAVAANDEMGQKWWAPKPYEPTRYEITLVSKNEVAANHPFPIKGILKINRNTLIVYRALGSPLGLEEASFKCQKASGRL